MNITDKFEVQPIKFSDLLLGTIGKELDVFFEKNNWELQSWKNAQTQGYQVFFGEGVQVDNNYEYGFPYLFEKDELIGFANHFYEGHVCQQKPSLADQIQSASSRAVAFPKSMTDFHIMSIEECQDADYGESLVQYGNNNGFVAFAFSTIPLQKAMEQPELVLNEILNNNNISKAPAWTELSKSMLDLITDSLFDMSFIEKDDEDWTKEMADQIWDESVSKGLASVVRTLEDDCFVTVYAGAMNSVNWAGHPEFGKPCLENILPECKEISSQKNSAYR